MKPTKMSWNLLKIWSWNVTSCCWDSIPSSAMRSLWKIMLTSLQFRSPCRSVVHTWQNCIYESTSSCLSVSSYQLPDVYIDMLWCLEHSRRVLVFVKRMMFIFVKCSFGFVYVCHVCCICNYRFYINMFAFVSVECIPIPRKQLWFISLVSLIQCGLYLSLLYWVDLHFSPAKARLCINGI